MRHMKHKRLLPLLWAAALSLSLLTPALAEGEELVPWYAEAQTFITQNRLMEGVEGGFSPQAPASRAVVFQCLWNLEGRPRVSRPFLFSDVSSDLWYVNSSAWAKDSGLSDGDCGAFRGERTITRAELAVVFARYLSLKGFPQVSPTNMDRFSDLGGVPGWAYDSVALCVAYGLITGDEGRIMSNATATQAELAAMLSALAQLTPPEVPDAVRYVEGLLDAMYLGQFSDEYLELSGLTLASAQRAYDAHLRDSADFFLLIYNVEYPNSAQQAEAMELFRQIYGQARFRTASVSQAEDGFQSVELTVSPLDIIRITDASMAEAMAPFYEKYPAQAQISMIPREYQAMDREWARTILELFQEKLPQMGVLPDKTISLQAELGDDGHWSLSQEELERLDRVLVPYFPT